MRTAVIATAICFTIVGIAAATDGEAAIRKHTEIPAQRLETALQALAQDRDLQVICRTEVVGDLRTTGASGELTRDEALKMLLTGTGLTYKYLDEKTITILPTQLLSSKEARKGPAQRQGEALPSPLLTRGEGGTHDSGRVRDPESAKGIRLAQAEGENIQEELKNEKLLEVVVTVLGMRSAARSALDAPVPVDVIGGDDLSAQGNTDIVDALTSVVPSFSANREPISDAATLVRPVNLRSLPSDSTLVLVNGKRRHRGAVVGEFISGVNRGAQGVDVNPLFGAALKQVEVLRDGASAQYGSDAIAGVVNYVLLDDPEIRSLTVQYGRAYEGDGEVAEVSGAFGVHVRERGFAALMFQARDANPTSRGVQDGEGTNSGAAGLAAAGFPVADPVVVWGAPEVKDDYKLIGNAVVPIGEAEEAELYAFGNYATRDVDGSFFYRNPASRSGVFASGGNVLFADTTGAGGCPVGPLPTGSFSDAQAFIDSAPNNCFAFFSLFPGGFTPRFGGRVVDHSVVGGLRGQFDIGKGFRYDISASSGENNVEYRIRNTVNASLGPDTPTEFDLGSQVQRETIINSDLSIPIAVDGFASDLNVAFGAQYHEETFKINAGQRESFEAGSFISQGFSAGSNGFQGFSDKTAGTFSRDSVGTYLDLEADITNHLLTTGAIRYENFSDFGGAFNGKVAARYKLTDSLAVRGAFSTGFRAPTLGQSNLQRASTGFSGGMLVEQLVIASTDPIAEFFGGGQLDPEDAQNISVGITVSLGDLQATIDLFDIDVKRRVSLTSIDINDADRAALIALGIPEAATVSNVQFFTNDFDTNTTGVDVVATYPVDWPGGTTDVTLAFNYTDTKVTNRGATIGAGREREIEDALPAIRSTLTLKHTIGNLNGLVRLNYFGEAYESLFNDDTLPVVTDPLFMVDAELQWRLAERFRLVIGAKNIFDEFPDEWRTAGFTGRDGGFLGAIYPVNHPAGLGGGSYYFRLSANF